MVEQVVFRMGAKRRGCHLITGEIVRRLPVLPEKGLLNVFTPFAELYHYESKSRPGCEGRHEQDS